MNTIFSTISHHYFVSNAFKTNSDLLIRATIELHKKVYKTLFPTTIKPHYLFDIRDLVSVFKGLILVAESKQIEDEIVPRLWYHEALRVYHDRLVTDEDSQWLLSTLNETLSKYFNISIESPILFCDFLGSYQEVTDTIFVQTIVKNFLTEYNNSTSHDAVSMYIFSSTIEHIAR